MKEPVNLNAFTLDGLPYLFLLLKITVLGDIIQLGMEKVK